MKDIYSGAKLVLSADRAASATEGFLGERIEVGQTFKLKSTLPSNSLATELVVCRTGSKNEDHSEAMHHFVLTYGDHDLTAYRMTREHPTFSRAWCMQEQQLATRIVHFTKSEMVWECLQDTKM